MNHSSRGSIAPDTVAIRHDDVIVALADRASLRLDNLYAYDAEYYFVLRLRQVLEPERWAQLPWAPFEPGQLLHAWDKFHGAAYFRLRGEAVQMSYGGDWEDLEAQVAVQLPLPVGVRAASGAPSGASLLAAIRANQLERVKELFGADPSFGRKPPAGVTSLELGVSVGRDSFTLWEAVSCASAEIVQALCDAGAEVDYRPPGGMTALHGAILADQPAKVEILLRAGADPRATFQGASALDLAERRQPSLAPLLRLGPIPSVGLR